MNEEGIRKRIRILLEEIQNEADPVILNRCRALFRQEVSFFHRSYMAAYLLLLAEEGKAAVSGGGKNRGRTGSRESRERPGGRNKPDRQDKNSRDERPGREGRAEREGRPGREDRTSREDRNRREEGRDRDEDRTGRNRPAPEAPRFLSEDESARLFISIGRNRKVFPREILALINARAGVDRDDIGAIRILDNYSFVQVRTAAADTVIAALNGHSFRGRTLTVNHARNRDEDALPCKPDGVPVPEDDVPGGGDTFSAGFSGPGDTGIAGDTGDTES